MDMYSIAVGDGNELMRGIALSTVLGLDIRTSFGRFRDAWLEYDDNGVLRIAIYTRNGGNNRPDYQFVTDALRQHPNYLDDQDDDFDSTYATYYFRFPPILPDHMRERGFTQDVWNEGFEKAEHTAYPRPRNMSEVWQEAIDRIGREGPTERQAAAFEPIAKALSETLANQDPEKGIPIIYTDGRVEHHKPEEGS